MSTIYDQVIMFFETYKETLTDDAKAAILPTVEYARGQLFGKIPKAELKHGAYYFGRSRNADTARWDARRNVFAYRRTKFGHTYVDTVRHAEDDREFDTFKPDTLFNPEDLSGFKEIPLPSEDDEKAF
jgi:hypothetical protein